MLSPAQMDVRGADRRPVLGFLAARAYGLPAGRTGGRDAEACSHVEFHFAVWEHVLPEKWGETASVFGGEHVGPAQLGQSGADCPTLPGMLTELAASLTAAGISGSPRTLLADAGYFSQANIGAALAAGIDPLLATGRLRRGEKPPPVPRGRIPAGLSPKARMSRKLHTKAEGRLRPTQSHRRTGLRPDQSRPRRPPAAATRQGQSRD